jgi:RNA polymerase sigma factor (sigma-70 family)
MHAEPAADAWVDASELWTAVAALPRQQRACIVLRYGEDLSERTVAKLLHCSVGTVKKQTHRALHTLRMEIDHHVD